MSDTPTRADLQPGSTIATDTRPNGATEEYVPRAAAQPRRETAPPPNESAPTPAPKRTRRALALPIAGIAVLLVAVAAVAYWRANLGLVKTDNAQTAGDVAPVSAQVAGTVAKLDVTDNQFVRSGQVLVELDPTDYHLALSSAQANLAAAQAQVSAAQAGLTAQEQQYSTGLSVAQGALQATTPKLPQAQAQLLMQEQQTAAQIAQAEEQVTTARSAIASAKANFDTASKTLSRDRQLLAQGAISQSQVDTDNAAFESAQATYQAAQDGLRQAQANLQSAQANRQQVTIAEQAITVNRGEIAQAVGTLRQAEAGNTLVQQKAQQLAAAQAQAAQAEQAVKSAQVNLSRTQVLAPADGWVTNRTVEPGTVVQPNQPLLSITLQRHVWVVANVKETQLGNVRVGNPVRIVVDVYRHKAFQGHVSSIEAATGSSVALLPPDNATGNFVKVVQLVPVYITLDPGTDPDQQLQVGLSAEVVIDTRRVDK